MRKSEPGERGCQQPRHTGQSADEDQRPSRRSRFGQARLPREFDQRRIAVKAALIHHDGTARANRLQDGLLRTIASEYICPAQPDRAWSVKVARPDGRGSASRVEAIEVALVIVMTISQRMSDLRPIQLFHRALVECRPKLRCRVRSDRDAALAVYFID